MNAPEHSVVLYDEWLYEQRKKYNPSVEPTPIVVYVQHLYDREAGREGE